jgi:beta-lactam-binding protein with PASTA domain
MPNLRGRQLADAAQALQQAGLKLGTVTATEAGATPGTILKQSPAPGQRVTPGMTVNFEVTK